VVPKKYIRAMEEKIIADKYELKKIPASKISSPTQPLQ